MARLEYCWQITQQGCGCGEQEFRSSALLSMCCVFLGVLSSESLSVAYTLAQKWASLSIQGTAGVFCILHDCSPTKAKACYYILTVIQYHTE